MAPKPLMANLDMVPQFTPHVGHYISDVCSVREGVWKSFNDSMVTEYREEDVRQRRQASGYLFFYMHKYVSLTKVVVSC